MNASSKRMPVMFLIAWIASTCLTIAGSTNPPPVAPAERTRHTVERADQMIGREVTDAAGKSAGRIAELVVDLESGRVLYAVIASRGFAGLGGRQIAVPVEVLRTEANPWRIEADQPKLKSAPQFTREQEERPDNPAFVGSVYKYFGQITWWGEADVRFNNAHKVSRLLGADLKDLSDTKIGQVNNVAIDPAAGRVVCVIISPTQNSGRPNGLCALPPNALTPSPDGRSMTTSIDPGKLAAAPRFEKDRWPDMADPAWASSLYQYFGKQAYFDSGELRATGRTNKPPRLYHEPVDPKKP